jgi:gliding motility-associated lipoprotein GldH
MKKIMLFVAFMLLISCNKNKIYHRFDKDFDLNRWNESDIQSYDFTILEENSYDIIIEFSHIYNYDMASIPLVITMKSPDGNEKIEKLDLAIKDDSGKQLADCSGDICDLKFTYKSNLNLLKGDYSISIANVSPQFGFLPNVLGIGLTVNRSK